MKHQQVVVDYWAMLKMSCTCLMLALSGFVLIKMIQTIFWLPGYLEKNQKRLEKIADQYSIEVSKDMVDPPLDIPIPVLIDPKPEAVASTSDAKMTCPKDNGIDSLRDTHINDDNNEKKKEK